MADVGRKEGCFMLVTRAKNKLYLVYPEMREAIRKASVFYVETLKHACNNNIGGHNIMARITRTVI